MIRRLGRRSGVRYLRGLSDNSEQTGSFTVARSSHLFGSSQAGGPFAVI